MKLDELTLGQIRELKTLFSGDLQPQRFPINVGENYFIRTVTMYYTGRVKAVNGDVIVLEKAAWIADTGRFYDFLKTGEASEVEPFIDDVNIPAGSVVDWTKWSHALLESQK